MSQENKENPSAGPKGDSRRNPDEPNVPEWAAAINPALKRTGADSKDAPGKPETPAGEQPAEPEIFLNDVDELLGGQDAGTVERLAHLYLLDDLVGGTDRRDLKLRGMAQLADDHAREVQADAELEIG